MVNDDDLDDSWIQEEERLLSIHKNYLREPMFAIDTYFVYMNADLCIEKIICEKQDLCLSDDKTFSILTKEQLLKLVQTKRIHMSQRYKLMDILSYNVDLEPENIQPFLKIDSSGGHNALLRTLPITNDITIAPSIFIFHGINSIYFLFSLDKPHHKHTLKSILRNSTIKPIEPSHTKRVRIAIDEKSSDNRITRKLLPVLTIGK